MPSTNSILTNRNTEVIVHGDFPLGSTPMLNAYSQMRYHLPAGSTENMAFHNEKADALEIRRLSFAQTLVGNSRQAFTKLVSGTDHDKLTEVGSVGNSSSVRFSGELQLQPRLLNLILIPILSQRSPENLAQPIKS